MPLQFRRGDETDRGGITPANGEPIWVKDGDDYVLYVGDGVTAGGVPVSGGEGGTVSPLTTKGDLYVYASANARLPVGSNGQVLTADSSQATGLRWASAPAAVVSQFSQAVAGNGHVLANVSVVGNADTSYDLDADPSNLVSGGTATLSPQFNVYHYAGLEAALDITLPTLPESGTLPYGQVSFSLGENGSVTLNDAVTWGKSDHDEPDAVIPTGDGQAFTIYYRYDPVVGGYVTHLEYLQVLAGGDGLVEIVPGSGQLGNVPNTNRHTFNHTHTFTSTSQNGGVYLVVVFAGDRISGSDFTPDSKLTQLVPATESNYPPRILVGIYKPTQADLNEGSESFTFTSNHPGTGETGQFYSFEIRGANPTDPLDTVASNFSTADRTSVASVPVSVANDDSLIVTVAGTDNFSGAINFTPNALNSFTQQVAYTGTDGVIIVFYVHVKAADEGSHDTPSFTLDTANEAQLVALVFQP